MRYAQFVMGSAGTGKSTYCSTIQRHAADKGRVIDIVNLDPAAEIFDYEPLVDIRDLIQLDDAMEDEELHFGPNGGLIFCLEFLIENTEWLRDALDPDSESDDDYIIFDLPGQIELFTHLDTGRKLIKLLEDWNFRVCGVFIIDSQFMTDGGKFISGTLTALSVMANLEIPHINILSKMDLLSKTASSQLEKYLEPDAHALLGEITSDSAWGRKHKRLSEAIGNLVEDYSLVRFTPLNIDDEESISDVLFTIDNIIQYGEDSDVKVRDDFDPPEENDHGLEDPENYSEF